MIQGKDQNRSCLSTPCAVSDVTRSLIVALFDSYDFRDREGHRLTMCQDFHDLISLMLTNNPKDTKEL